MKNSRQHFNVVILDDDFLIKEVLKKLIKRYLPDAEFFVSNNGLEGIGLIELHAPQLIIADATLPKYAGAELVNRLKNTKGFTADTNVVFLHESDKFPELNDPAIIKLNKSDISFIKEFEKYLAFTFSKTPQYSFREKAQNILGGVIVKVSNYCDVLMHSVSKSRSLLHIPRYLIWIILQVYLSFVMTIFYIFTGGRVPENKNTSARELTLYRVRYYPTIVTITLAVIGIVFQTFAFLVAGLAILNQNINFLIAQSVCPLPAAPSIINNQVTLTPDNEDGIIDCSAVDIIVGSTGELIIEKRVDGNGNTQGDYGVTLLVNNLTVQSGGKVNADGKGYSIVETDAGAGKGGSSSGQTGGAGGGHGGAGGQGIEDGVNASGFGGTPYGNNETPITLGAAGGNGGNTAGNFQRSWSSNAHFTALGTSFSEGLESPVAGGLALKASSQDPLTYSTGEQTWFSGIIDAAQFELFKPTNITADWTLDGTDNIAPKFQIWGSATGSFSGEQAVYPAADAYYQNGGTYSINDNSQLSITDQVQTFYRYWQVKIILETGATDTDTPKVVSLTINGATQQSSNPSGGAGGGALKIVASQAVVIDGTISANGLDGQASGNTSGGGGAGGSIWILANTFAGSGSVQAKGGSAAEVTYQGGGGGGGRIVMLCTTSNGFTGTASVTPGVTANSQDGGVGTIIGATCSPNAPTILKQFKSNQLTEVPIGGITTESTVVFVGDLSDVDASDVLSLQIEVRPLGQEFTGVPTHTQSTAFANPQPCSSPVANCGRITVTGMTRSLEYHWRARVRDNKGGYSAWISFGANNENERDILLTGNPAAIQFVSGNSQSGTVNTNLPSPLVVRVVDVEGYPVPGYTVNWTVVAGATGGQLVAGNAVTDNDGYSSRTYKLGQKIGTNTIRAAGSGLAGSPIDFSATGNPDVIAKFTVTGPQYAITNEQFGPVTVTAYDQYDNVKVDYIGTPAVSAVKAVDGSASAGTISPSTLSFTIENAGIVELSTFSHNTVESIRIKITDGAATGLSNTIAIVDSLGSCPDVDGIIDGNQTWTSDLTNMGIFDCRNVEMVWVTSNAVLTLTSYNNGNGVWTDDFGATVLANDIVIDSGSTISSNARGYSQNRGGGTQGVYGGYSYNNNGTPYGSVYEPRDLGSSSGGGAIKLVVEDTLTNNGSITSNGNTNTVGSGGSIWIDTDILAGSGTIAANAGTNSDYRAANGSGGRIAVYYSDDQSTILNTLGTASPKITAQSTGGMGQWSPKPSGAGTIYIENKINDVPKQGSLFVRNLGDNTTTQRAAIVQANEVGISEFVFKQITLTNAGHLDVVGQTSTITLTQGDKLTGDATTPRLSAFGTFKYTGEDTLVISGADVAIRGKLELVNGYDVVVGGSIAGKLTLYANTWYYNDINNYVFNDVSIASNGTINLISYNNGDSNWTNDYGLTFNAENLNIASGGKLSASGTGYGQNRGGGTYGVYGGYANNSTGTPYGSVYEPKDLGSSSGGGAIKLNIGNTLTNNGTIESNGNANTSGTGGSIWVDTNILAGSGTIAANAGTNSDYRAINGSGGRIAIYYNDDQSSILNTLGTASPKVTAQSTGCTCSWTPQPSGPGTIYVEDKINDISKQGALYVRNVTSNNANHRAAIVQANESGIIEFVFREINLTNTGHLDVVGNTSIVNLTQGDKLTGDSTAPKLATLGTFRYSGENTLVISGTDVTIKGKMELVNGDSMTIGGSLPGKLTLNANTWYYNSTNSYELGDVNVTGNGTLNLISYNNGDSNWTNDYGVTLLTRNITVASGGIITASGTGYSQNRGGGSQGVYGGYSYDNNGTPYGSVYEPKDLGSSSGGGAIKLVVTETLTNNGTIESNGNAQTVGSGGSIWIDTNTIAGSGTIAANGSTNSDYRAANGSGGRIAVYYNDDQSGMLNTLGTASPKIQANSTGGMGQWSPKPSGAGTIYVEDKANDTPKQGSLFVRNVGDNLATHRAAIIMSQETGVTEFVFKQIKLTNSGHLDVVENTSIINLTQGDKLTGDSTAPKLVASGIFRYSGEDTLVVDGTDVTINGKLELINGDDVELGGNLPGKLTLYANTWYYNNENTHLFGDITVNSNGTLNLVSYNNGDSNWTNDYGVTLSAENITVAEGGIVTASGTGYGQNRGGGNQGVYGGYATDGTGTPYGSVYEPKDLGSSSGGGAIKLIVSNTLTNNGTIQSNGNAETVGSGGSIWIDTNTIAGGGIITANGSTNSDYRALNGSGGRIAIYYNTDSSEILNTLGTGSAKVRASSTGCDCEWTPKPSGAGTVYIEDKQNDTPKQGSLFIRNVQTSNKSRAAAIIITQETDIDKFVFKRVNLTSYGNLSVVGNDSVFELSNGEGLNGDSTLASLITFGTFNYTGEDILKIDGADLTIRGNMVLQNNNIQIGGTNAGGLTLYANTWHYNNENKHELGDVHVTSNGVLKLVSYNSGDSNWTNDYGVQLTANNLTIDEGGVVTSSGFGYGQNRGGGSQGVYGGYAYDETGAPYGSLFEPVDLGSSSGGGAMKLIINQTLTNNGSILSNGNAETTGSGGSIWIDTDVLAGNGIITANAGTNSDYRAINGSGGRVAIYYVTDESGMLSTMGTDTQKIEARSNGCICEWVPHPSGPGTVYIENKGVVEPHQGDLFIHNGGGQGRAMDFDATDYFFNNVYIGKNVKVKMNQNLSAIRSNESISDEENVEDTGDAFAIWTFEEEADGSCSGGGDYCDTSNNNRNLSAVGSERTTGKVGNGLLLTGENYAEVDIPGAWVSSFSVGMWVRLDELTANGSDAEEFINFNNISTTSSFDIDGSGNLRFEWPSKLVTGVEETTNFLPVGEWRHLVATYNGSTGQRRIYINGQLAAQDTADPSYTLEISKISIGKGGLGSSTGLVGAIDEVFIYPRVLTDTELMVYVNTYSWEEYNNKRGRGPVLNLTGDITVDQGALLTAKGLGFPSEEGLGRGIRGSGQSGGAGGGHGGSGGNGESDGGSAGPNGGTFYGNQRRPFTLGSGGGRAGTGAAGGTGGGAIALRARTGNVNIFGTLDVSGTNGLTASPGGGGGAGGSILIEGQTCDIPGNLLAEGGNGGDDAFDGGGGGGGRISILYTQGPCEATGNVTVANGSSNGGQPGQVGTFPTISSIPSTPSFKEQYKADGLTNIPVGGTTPEQTVNLKVSLSDPGASVDTPKNLTAEFEIVGVSEEFLAVNILKGKIEPAYQDTVFAGVVNSPSYEYIGGDPLIASVNVAGLQPGGEYKWRARVISSDNISGQWTEFGNNSSNQPDFVVTTTNILDLVPSTDTVEVGEPLTLIVNAKNGDDIDPSYRGTVEFESSSESADVPANYEFGEEDNGSHTFTDSVVFYEPGTHTVTVNDLLASNLEDTITINVLAPEVPTSTPVGGVTPEFCEQNPNALECNVVVITNVTKKIIDNTTVEVCFDTNIPTVAVINYGLSEGATYTDSVIVSSEYATHHCVTLKNLEDNSGYIMEIVATAQNGKQGKHSDAFATDENIEVIPIADAKQCIAIDPNGYTFNSKGQAILNFKTAEPAFCKVVYGNSKDDLPHTFELKEKVENHKAVLELSKLDGVSDLFYKIDCVNLERTCISSGVIPASRYKSYYPQKPLEITISETALPVALLIVTGATFLVNIMSYPGFMMYAIPWLTSRRRKSTWGIVYDEKTNEPVPFVMIRLYNSMGQIVKQVVTGFDGKYGFTVNKGVYTIKVSHSDYQEYKFDVEIHEKEGIAAENVGLIRKSTGQSKSIKDKIKRFMSKIKKHLFNINRVIVIAGFLLSIIALVITRSPLNVLVTLVYLVQFAILILLGRGKRDWGYVYDSKSSKRIKGASVRVFNIRESRQVDVQLTDEEGRFGFNLEDGEYYLQVNANGYSMDEGSIGKYDKLQSATGYTLIKVVVKKGKKINVALPLKADKAFTSKFAMGE